MHVIEVSEPGGPEVMKWCERPDPEPGPGELVVRVEAAGVNFIDIYQRSGFYPLPLPLRLGLEGAGTVTRIGEGVTDFAVGARVAWASARGSYATHVAVPAARAVPVPDGLDPKLAAAVMLQGMTAHYLSHATHALAPGETCVVYAASGGVGLLLCQMARRRGARVVGVVSTEDKAKLARGAGADEVVVTPVADLGATLRHLAGDRGADVVYDSVGRDTLAASLAALRPRGLLVSFGQSSGPVPPLDTQELSRRGSLFLTRPTLADYVATREELLRRAGDVLGWVKDGSLSVRVDRTLPISDAREAHRLLASRATKGKVLLVP